MVTIGYKLCSEERTATALVRDAAAAEEAGFDFSAISDHYHPWMDVQGESPFVWTVLGAIAARTRSPRVGTAVTCPIQRIHPALVAQAAATTAELFNGRFFLGLGSGENLNEHIVGERWPSAEHRRKMLLEAMEIIRALFSGEFGSYDGRYFTVDRARLYTLPDELLPLSMAAFGYEAAVAAGEKADGIVGTPPDAELLEAFATGGGGNKPKVGELTVCFAPTREAAIQTVHMAWPLPAFPRELSSELPLPRHFEQAAEMVDVDDLSEIPIGPDAEPYLKAIEKYERAGYDHVTIHQVGRAQGGFMAFAVQSLIPQLRGA